MNIEHIMNLLVVQAAQLAIVIAVIAIISITLLRHRPHLAYVLWLVALAKCLCPPVWSSPTSVFSWANLEKPPIISPASEAITQSRFDSAVDPTGVPASAGTVLPAVIQIAAPLPQTQTPRLIPWINIFIAIWLTGTTTVLVATTVASARLFQKIHRSKIRSSRQLAALAEDLRAQIRLRRTPHLAVCNANLGPAVLGFLRPTVVIPHQLLNTDVSDLRAVLAHELIHIRRGDAMIAAVQRLAVAIWWFHPLVWLMSARLTAAREQCCDEETIATLQMEPAAYAQTLLDVARHRRMKNLALYPGVHAMQVTKKRIGHLMDEKTSFHNRPPRAAWALMLAAVLLLVPGAGLTFPQSPAGDPPPASQPTTQTAPAVFHGSVVDAEDHLPIAGIRIKVKFSVTRRDRQTFRPNESAGESEALTDQDGKFDLAVPRRLFAAPNDVMLDVDLDHPDYGGRSDIIWLSYLLQDSSENARKPASATVAHLTYALRPCMKASGRVLGPDGNALAGAPVESNSYDTGYGSGRVNYSVRDISTTDASGRFKVHLFRQAKSMIRFLPGHAGAFAEYLTGQPELGEFTAPPGREISGSVHVQGGAPLAGAHVWASPFPSQTDYNPVGELAVSAIADVNGRFTLSPLARGTYRIRVGPPGAPQSGRLPANLSMPIGKMQLEWMESNLFVDTQIIVPATGTVPDIDIRPVPTAKIIVRAVDPQGHPSTALPAWVLGNVNGVPGAWLALQISPDTVEATVPKGLTEAKLGINEFSQNDNLTVARFRRGDGPVMDVDMADLGTIADNANEITVIRYPRPQITLKVSDQEGHPLPAAKAWIAYPKTDRPAKYMEYTSFSGTYSHVWCAQCAVPGQPFELGVEADGFQASTQQLTLQLGENKTVEVKLTRLPTTKP